MDTRAAGTTRTATWADRLREPPFHVLRAWTDEDSDTTAATWIEGAREVWGWLASVLPDTLRVDVTDRGDVVRLGSIEMRIEPVQDATLTHGGWPAGSRLVLRAPRVTAVVLPDDHDPGWVISRSDDPEAPTLVAVAPTLPSFHRELAHRVWHRAVDFLVEAGDREVDPETIADAVHVDVVSALSRGWRQQLLWVPAIVEGHGEWRADLAGVPTGSWLDADELPHPYRLEGTGSVLRAVAVS
ncbi:MAG: hypothetical protein M0Z51_17700 [Propionibacterium sp.]|nr:hypothetical protein [Propionibacterium sp.]